MGPARGDRDAVSRSRVDGSRVVVVGGGIAGAMTALLLARSGAAVTVLERVATPAPVGAALLLQPNGLAVLDGAGVGGAVRERATALPGGVALRDARGRPLVPSGEATDLVVVRRSDLADVLEAALAEARVDLRRGVTATGATPDGRVTTATGETLRADVVVAADGTSSRLRPGLVAARVRRTGVRYLRTIVDAPPPPGLVGETWGRDGVLGVAPVGAATYLYSSCRSPRLRDVVERGDWAAFVTAWARDVPAAEPLLVPLATRARGEGMLVHEVVDVRCRRLSAGRVALVGDAAHAMAPNLGQGANSGLVDAAVLAHELAAAGDDVVRALSRYDARRRPAVTRVQRLAAAVMRASDAGPSAARAARDAALRLGARLPAGGAPPALVLQEDPAWLRGAAAVRA